MKRADRWTPLAQQRDGRRLDMGTDRTTSTSARTQMPLVSAASRRQIVRLLVFGDGSRRLSQYEGEWWHYDGPGSGTPRPHPNAPVYLEPVH